MQPTRLQTLIERRGRTRREPKNRQNGVPQPPADALAKLEAARKSVEDAAPVSGVLWLSYLFTLFYIGVAAGGVTHKQLLLEDPVKLPFLSVDLPLVAFFALSPILFVIVHAYTLMHFIVLAAKTSICSRFSSGA